MPGDPRKNEEIQETIKKIREKDQEQQDIDQFAADAPDAATWHPEG
jgi:hypothetical protein